MGNLALVLLLFSLVLAVPAAHIEAEVDQDWRESLGLGKEKVTRLHFYYHDTPSATNPSTVTVATATTTDKSPTLFGLVMVADDPLTEGPSPNSELVGRAQGLYAFSGQQVRGVIMAMDYRFSKGEYEGSSLSICGRNQIMDTVRETPIVGGTGYFRLARGTAITTTSFFNLTTGDAIVEYNITVIHY